MAKQILFTKEGYEDLKKEYQELLNSRKPAVEDLKKAREMGDLSENGYYKAAKFKLSSIDYNLRRLNRLLKSAAIVENTKKDVVDIGSKVTLKTDNKNVEYLIVGGYESDPSKGKISHLSPLGKELIGKKANDIITITTPSGETSYKIEKVD